MGGDFIYAAWRLTYNEPVFQDRQFLGGFFPVDSDIYKGQYRDYSPGLCPVAESIQPKLMQFKTNYVDLNEANRQTKILRKTIESISLAEVRCSNCAPPDLLFCLTQSDRKPNPVQVCLKIDSLGSDSRRSPSQHRHANQFQRRSSCLDKKPGEN